MPKPNNKMLKSYLTSEEYAAISASAHRAKLSVSAFARRVCLGQEVNSLIDLEAVLLVKNSKADLGRLGGLLKKHLSETGGTEDWHQELRGLLRSIEYSQRKLTKEYYKLYTVHPRYSRDEAEILSYCVISIYYDIIVSDFVILFHRV